jgi:hypothetical protein
VIWPARAGTGTSQSTPRSNGSEPLVPELEEVSPNGQAETEEAPF